MQRDDRLAGSRTARDRDHTAGRGPDGAVLLGLDGGHDRVHRPVPRTRQLGHQRTLADDRQVTVGRVVEQLVLDPDHPGAGAPQHAPAYDVVRVGGGGLVEHRGGGCAPVDQHGVPVVVAETDPADVPRLGIDLVAQVEATENESLVGGVELRDPLRGLEDHGVALDETALVAQAAASVALAGKRLRGPGGLLELAVDAVHELLLASDLPLGKWFGQRWFSLSPGFWQVHKPTPARDRPVTTSSGSGTPSSHRGPRPTRTGGPRGPPSPPRRRRCGRPGRG